MHTCSTPSPSPSPSVLLPSLSPAVLLASVVLVVACDGGSTASSPHAHVHAAENVSGIQEGVWPPQPLDMEDERRLPAELRTRARLSVIDAARSAVLNNPAVLSAIGENYGSFDASLSTSKSGDVATFVFFNYDTRRSVEAILGGDGAVTVQSEPASVWQPTENAVEVDRAVSLARTALEANGHSLDTLEGTAMLTYPAATSGEPDTPDFHAERILYVTFGPGDGEPPLYSARVNVGTDMVSDGGPLR